MYLELQKRLGARLSAVLKEKYDLELEAIPLEIPPELKFGELSTPIAFELARKLRKAPKVIAQEIVAALSRPEGIAGFASFEVAGAGYINARLDRTAGVRMIAATGIGPLAPSGIHSLVEHTSINPNKAAHIGHLRNAILGDTFVRLLRAAGQKVDVQNYIDNTGVQVADVVVGLMHIKKMRLRDVRFLLEMFSRYCESGGNSKNARRKNIELAILKDCEIYKGKLDYYLWDVYARTSNWFGDADALSLKRKLAELRVMIAAEQWPSKAEDARIAGRSILKNLSVKQRKDVYLSAMHRVNMQDGLETISAGRKRIRYATLHEIERGGNETSEIAELISTAVLRRHLETMLRLDIEYDFLPRESEILRLKFWDAAFEQLKQTGVLYFETEGKNKGCWVMTRPASEGKPGAERIEGEVNEDAKVIVRSNGTVTYVGKDIAYHLWKFGLLGKDFGYKPFFRYPDLECWISAEHGVQPHPQFGGAQAIYNVIDARQSDPQANVIQALRGMGYTDQADRFTHFSYGMVALTPGYAKDLGYVVSAEDFARPYIEISGRKGFGVKADDLMDLMILAANEEILARHPDWEKKHRNKVARQIAYGAIRYFMLKYTRNSVIAFDQESALSPEGETGPYIQYAVVRARNIFRKAGIAADLALAGLAGFDASSYLNGEGAEDIWALWLRAGRRTLVLDQCIATSEPAHLAKHAFQLAQEFNNFYHKHHILTEEDPARKTFLLATAAAALRELIAVLSWLGIESPEAM